MIDIDTITKSINFTVVSFTAIDETGSVEQMTKRLNRSLTEYQAKRVVQDMLPDRSVFNLKIEKKYSAVYEITIDDFIKYSNQKEIKS